MLLVSQASEKGRRKNKVKVKKQPKTVNVGKIVHIVDKMTPRYCDLGLLLAVLGLCVFGVFMVYSASRYNAVVYYDDEYFYMVKQLIGLLMGIVAIFIMYFIDYKKISKYAYLIYIVGVVLLAMVFIPGVGISKLGATRWIGIGSLSIQPSEVAKFAFVIFAAKVFSNKGKVINNRLNQPGLGQTLLVLFAGGLMCLLIIMEPNMSITMTVGIVMFVIMFLCGVSVKTMGIIILPAIVAVVVMLVAEPYRLKRLSAFIDPWANPKEEGFQLIESLYGIANGGLFGVGYGNSMQKNMFLPFSESDFIFSIIAEEFGLVGCLLLFCVFAYIVYKIFKIGYASKDFFGRFLCFGIGTVIAVQSALNFCVATGCIPPTGLPMPFVSFGGTSLLVFMSAIGIVLNIDKQSKSLIT